MQHPEEDQNLTGYNTGPRRRSAQDVLFVKTYQTTIHNLSLQVLEIDWTEVAINFTKIKTVDTELRKVIAAIEGLRSRPIAKRIRLNGVLQNLYNALSEFSRARTLAQTKAQLKLSQDDKDDLYEKVNNCRSYLYQAEEKMKVSRQQVVDN